MESYSGIKPVSINSLEKLVVSCAWTRYDALKRSTSTRVGERIKWWGGGESLASIRGKGELYGADQRLHFAAVPASHVPPGDALHPGRERRSSVLAALQIRPGTYFPAPYHRTRYRSTHPGSCSPAASQRTSSERLRDYSSQHTRRGPPPPPPVPKAGPSRQAECGSPQASSAWGSEAGLTL